jgi:hypothetical protein
MKRSRGVVQVVEHLPTLSSTPRSANANEEKTYIGSFIILMGKLKNFIELCQRNEESYIPLRRSQ